MNEWALITGASLGIGRELAILCAADHRPVVLIARQQPPLEELARQLRSAYGIEALVLPKDLASDRAPQEIFDTLREMPISLLINNAGFGLFGPHLQGDLESQARMMEVNMTSLVRLTHLFARPMVERGAGRILNVASVAAFLPGPNSAIYYASKAFVHSYSLALAEELSRAGVTVTSLCPGGTRTEFHTRAGMVRSDRKPPMMDARTVAEIGYRAMLKGKRVAIPGLTNQLVAKLLNFVPATATARLMHKLNHP